MEKGAVKLQYVATEEQTADVFTKPGRSLSTSDSSLVWSLERGNDDVLLKGQFYSDRTRVVNCQYDRMSNHTKIHQEDVWL